MASLQIQTQDKRDRRNVSKGCHERDIRDVAAVGQHQAVLIEALGLADDIGEWVA